MTRKLGAGAIFLAPALVLLGALVVYPTIATIDASFRDASGAWSGLANYRELASNPRIVTALRNNAVWVLVVPSLVTAVGLVFAVATERITLGRALKTAVFMPMALSFLASGVIWRLVYEDDPRRGLLNASIRAVSSAVRPPGDYAGATPSEGVSARDGDMVADAQVREGDAVVLGLLGISADRVPANARTALPPDAAAGRVTGVVFRDFTPGAAGTPGVVDGGESGLPGVTVVLRGPLGGSLRTVTDAGGAFAVDVAADSRWTVELAASNFREPFAGVRWLGAALVTPAAIVAYIWMWAGFSMVVIAAGLAAVPRDLLEAARVDGAGEWQVFRRITVPLLAPVLGVVFVTMVINVLKVFDIVLVVAPEAVQSDANVIALEMWRTTFGARRPGLGSAVAVVLFVLVLPVMVLNLRRFRTES